MYYFIIKTKKKRVGKPSFIASVPELIPHVRFSVVAVYPFARNQVPDVVRHLAYHAIELHELRPGEYPGIGVGRARYEVGHRRQRVDSVQLVDPFVQLLYLPPADFYCLVPVPVVSQCAAVQLLFSV